MSLSALCELHRKYRHTQSVSSVSSKQAYDAYATANLHNLHNWSSAVRPLAHGPSMTSPAWSSRLMTHENFGDEKTKDFLKTALAAALAALAKRVAKLRVKMSRKSNLAIRLYIFYLVWFKNLRFHWLRSWVQLPTQSEVTQQAAPASLVVVSCLSCLSIELLSTFFQAKMETPGLKLK